MGGATEPASRKSQRPRLRPGGALSLLPFALGLLLLIGAAAPVENTPRAQDEKPERTQPPTARPTVHTLFRRAYAALEAEDYPAVLLALGKVRHMEEKLSSYERSLMWWLYGYAYTGLGRSEQALDAFEKSFAVGGLPDSRYNLGQLYIANEQYRKGIDTLEAWIEDTEDPGPEGYFLIANAYVSLDRYKEALQWAEQGLARMDEPRESWLALTLALYFEDKQYSKCIPVLELLVTHFPKKQYWKQLAGVYGELGEEKKQLEAFERAFRQGLLTTSGEFVQMAGLFFYHDVPHKTAVLLELGLESGAIEGTAENRELLADAWTRVRDYPTPPDDDVYVRLAMLYAAGASAVEVCAALNEALRSTGLPEQRNALTLAGMARWCPVPAPGPQLGPGDFRLPGVGSSPTQS